MFYLQRDWRGFFSMLNKLMVKYLLKIIEFCRDFSLSMYGSGFDVSLLISDALLSLWLYTTH